MDKKIVERMAYLSRLNLTDDEISNATRDLTNILNHFATIQDIDTSDVPTYDNAAGLTNVTRADEAKNEDLCDCAALIEATPAVSGRYIQVHAVFDDTQNIDN